MFLDGCSQSVGVRIEGVDGDVSLLIVGEPLLQLSRQSGIPLLVAEVGKDGTGLA